MTRNNFMKLVILFTLLLNFLFLGYSAYPQVVFTQNSFSSGQVNVNLQASSGIKVFLYVNGNLIGQKDSIASGKDIYLSSDISDQSIAIGQNLRFINNNSARVYPLNFTTGTFQSLAFTENLVFRSYREEFVDYTDMNASVTKTITVKDELTNINFTNINSNFLNDGDNNISFVYYSILNNTKLGEKNQIVTYDKYSNKINAYSINITNTREARVNGTVTNPNAPLFFVLNNNGVIGNLGQLNQITLNSSSFSILVGNLKEGNNTIRFISVDPVNNQIFNGEKKLDVFVDTIAPSIQIVSATYTASISGKTQTLNADLTTESFINGNILKLNITTDAENLTVQFNKQNTSYVVKNNSLTFDLSLVKGQNNLTLIATDIAGNIYKEAHAIWFDNEAITLKNMTPTSGSTVHFFIQDFEGFVNKGDIEITAFAIPKKANFWDPSTNTNRAVTCKEYEFLGIRDLGQIRPTITNGPNDPSYNPDDLQLSLSGFISGKITTKSSSNGKFKIENMILQDDSFDSSDVNNLNRTVNPTINKVNSLNTVCFVMSDKYGNIVTKDTTITLDSGNTMWRAGEITTMPNTIYAAEIEQTGDQRSGNGKVRFGVIAKLQYIGTGKLTNVNGVKINTDGSLNVETKNARIVDSEMKFSANPETNEMLIYFPVEVSPLGKKPLDYPKELKFHFKANFYYNLNDKAIPIDTINPVYFSTTVNVERPLDHSKWLTPDMIDGTLAFLNKSILYTKKATNVMGIASVGGVLTCTGAKFYHGYKMAELIGTEKDPQKVQEEKAKLDRELYMICDRIACTTAPAECSSGDNNGFTTTKPINSNYVGALNRDQYTSAPEFKGSSEKVLGEFTETRINGNCSFTNEIGAPVPGVLIEGTMYKYEKEVGLMGSVADVKGISRVRSTCARVSTDKNGNINGINLNDAGNACYSKGAPKFDDTRCNIGGLTFGAFENPLSGRSSSSSIIDSVACGCITDTYSHLKSWLKVQEGIQKCLMQAKIGNTKGSYCERLMSQAVCDIATNVVLPEIERQIKPGSPGTDGTDRNPAANFLTQMRKTDKELNDRYSGTFLSQAGLSTDQIMNKACVAAITGDWSVLTDNILTAIDKNEVEPVFGPPFPESRLQGYNPITGTIAINYRFTYGAISGGQSIQTTVELICDKNEHNGEYCPDDGIVMSSQVPNSEFKTKTLSVPKGGSVQDTVVINEDHARFWYNKIRLTHVYTIKGETKTRKEEFTIVHKSESLFASCYFSGGTMGAGASFKCNSLFGEDALISSFQIDKTKTKIVPQNTFYPGNQVYLDLTYSSRNSQTVNEAISLAYMAVCKNSKNENLYLGKKEGWPVPHHIELSSDTPDYSRKVLKLYDIPQFADPSSAQVVTMKSINKVSFNGNNKYALKLTNLQSTSAVGYQISKIYLQNDNGEIILNDININNYITQNFNVNNANAQQTFQYLDFSKITGTGYLNIEFSGPVSGISLSVIQYKDLSSPTNLTEDLSRGMVAQFTTPNTNLAQGTCELRLRVLPTSQASQLTTENFDSFSQISSNFTNAVSNDIVKMQFSVKPTPQNAESTEFFDLSSFSDGTYICIDSKNLNGSVPITLGYIYQNAANSYNNNNIDLAYSISVNGYGTLPTTQSSSKLSNLPCGSITATIDKLPEGMKTQFKTNAEKSTASAWILSSSSTIEGKISYTATNSKSDKNKILNPSKKEVKVYFVSSDKCSTLGKQFECKGDNTPKSSTSPIQNNLNCNTQTQTIPCTCDSSGNCKDRNGNIVSGLISVTSASQSNSNTQSGSESSLKN